MFHGLCKVLQEESRCGLNPCFNPKATSFLALANLCNPRITANAFRCLFCTPFIILIPVWVSPIPPSGSKKGSKKAILEPICRTSSYLQLRDCTWALTE